jgi:putative tryptophan/tyrosine transport system substrate-binding protein
MPSPESGAGMRRREFIMLLSGATAWPIVARAQQPEQPRRIGVLLASGAGDPEMQARLAALQQDLRTLGWTDGDNLRIDLRWFGGSSERAEQQAKEIAALAPDVIVANATVGIEAVLKTTRSIPTVFVMVGNPVGSGYVASMSRPGANVTGFSAFEPEITGKWMQVLQEIAPATKHVTFLIYPGYEFLWHGAEAAAGALGLSVSQATAHNAAEIERAIASAASRPDAALIVMPTPVFATNRELIARLTASHQLPALYPFRYYAAAGGLISYGMDAVDIFRRASQYVDRILKGENPGDLPIQAPTKFELVINLKTAKALGLTVPVTLLARADEVIE